MKKLLLLLTFYSGIIHADISSLQKPLEEDVLLMTIPKSGSHLLLKLLYLISGKEHYNICWEEEAKYFPPRFNWSDEKFAANLDQKAFGLGKIPLMHCHVSEHVDAYLSTRPEIKTILLIRDLRDVCVSAAYFFQNMIQAQYGPWVTFDQRLMWVLTANWGKSLDHHSNIRRQVEEMLGWMNRPNTFLIRFEDLIGPKGGGSIERQKKVIAELCTFLSVELTPEETDLIIRHLWGGKWTFRKGQLGTWRSAFKPAHIQTFKQNFGPYLIALGYEEDENW